MAKKWSSLFITMINTIFGCIIKITTITIIIIIVITIIIIVIITIIIIISIILNLPPMSRLTDQYHHHHQQHHHHYHRHNHENDSNHHHGLEGKHYKFENSCSCGVLFLFPCVCVFGGSVGVQHGWAQFELEPL